MEPLQVFDANDLSSDEQATSNPSWLRRHCTFPNICGTLAYAVLAAFVLVVVIPFFIIAAGALAWGMFEVVKETFNYLFSTNNSPSS